jgi:hypothetical protein
MALILNAKQALELCGYTKKEWTYFQVCAPTFTSALRFANEIWLTFIEHNEDPCHMHPWRQ